MESLLSDTGTWLGGLGSLALALVSFLAKRYVVPFLTVARRRKYAEYIAAIADEVTDDLRARYPDRAWLAYLDEAVDTLIGVCGVSKDVARRAVMAATARK